MLCENCQKKSASLFIKAVTEEEVGEVRLCYKCAKEVGLLEGYSSEDLPSVMLFVVELINPLREEVASKRCLNCGLSLVKFMETNKFGCGECYTVFADYLDDLFIKLHGSTRHREEDTQPFKSEKTVISSRLTRLNEKLNEAVKGENYEEAARLRDKILSLKKIPKRRRSL
jgi:protein arginine kinase activator